MNKGLRRAGWIFVLSLLLGFGYWQRQGQAAGQSEGGLSQVFSTAGASGGFGPAPHPVTAPALASTITVTSLGDGAANAANCPGASCRLRDAIEAAAAGDTIDFAVTGTIILGGELVITKSLTINGPGAAQLTISGNTVGRVFRISKLPTAISPTVALNGLKIANGWVNGSPSSSYTSAGGGIFSELSHLTITNSTISFNRASYFGGGILVDGGIAIIINSTLSGNFTTSGNGSAGGIYLNGAQLNFINSTLSGNTSQRGGGLAGSGSTNLINSTLTGNTATLDGGAIFYSQNHPVQIRNTIIAGNSAVDSGPDVIGKLTSQGYNLIGNNSGTTITPTAGDQIGTAAAPINPQLGPLANNGGPTQTHALLPSSPALDAGAAGADPNTGQPLTTDQRGGLRPVDLLSAPNAAGGNASDIGAFELQSETTLTINPNTLPDAVVGSPYNQTLSATGGSGNYSFSLSSGNFPSGLTLSASGQISGTPTGGGPFTFTVKVTDNSLLDVYGSRSYTVKTTSVCTPAPSGLVAWWRAEGSAQDSAGSNHATFNGSATFSTAAEGHVGRAFKFDGTNGYVALPDNLFPFPTSGVGSTPFSFELWFKTGSGGVILGQQTVAPYNTLSGFVPAIYVGTDGKLRVEMFWGGTKTLVVSAGRVNDNLVFHHLAVTYTGVQQTVYLDGQLMGVLAEHFQTAYGTNYKYQLGTGGTNGWPSGSTANGGWFNFNGLIDEPSLYDHALTDEEVQALFGAGNAGKCSSCPTINATVTGGGAICSGGSATVTVTLTGGTAPYTVTLSNGGGTKTGPSPLSFTVSPAATTTYEVQAATDAKGCTVVASGSATVTVNTPPTVGSYPNTTIAPGGNTTVTPASAPSDNGTITSVTATAPGFSGTLSGNTTTGAIAITGANPPGSYTVTVTVTDNCGATTQRSFTLTVNTANTAPTINAAAVARQQGSPAAAAQIATVLDAEDVEQSLTVTVAGGAQATVNGVTVSNLAVNAAGQVTASVVAGCTASNANFALTVTDTAGATANAALTVTVTANAVPTVGAYPNTLVAPGGTTTVTPSVVPADNGSIASITATATPNFFSGDLTANTLTGALTITGANPLGSYTIAITVTDNCGAITTRSFMLTVNTCGASLSKTAQNFAANGGTGNFTVTIDGACTWTAVSNNPSFITVVSPAGQQAGNGTVSFSVASHSSSTPRSGTITVAGQTFIVRQGAQFLDVPVGTAFYEEIGKLSAVGVTQGCGGGNYCRGSNVTREQMAAFLIRALGDFTPAPPATQRFGDVPASNPFYGFIEQMAVRQITLGCGGGNYCPTANVTREQMAAFLIRALHAPGYVPPAPGSQRFLDVPSSSPFYGHIEEMAVRAITLGCGGGNYCPTANVTREQMAAFLVRAFGL
jgi:hypothetical protein